MNAPGVNDTFSRPKYQSFRLEKWNVFPKSLTLSGPDGKKKIGPIMMELLLIFVENQGRLLDTEILHKKVWKDVVVSDSTIRKTISNLKNHFSIDGKSYLDIQTVRSQGYELSEDVSVSYELKSKTPFNLSGRVTLFISAIAIALIITLAFTWLEINSGPSIVNLGNSAVGRSPELTQGGEKMVFSGSSDQQSIEDIFLFDFNSGGMETLVSSPYIETHPTITQDGKLLAYGISHSKQPNEIIELNIATGISRPLLAIDYTAPLRSLDWSPDGKQLAIASGTLDEPNFKIHLLNTTNLTLTRITEPHHQIYGDINPKYSTKGNYIAFIRTLHSSMNYEFFGGSGDIYLLNLNTNELQKITNVNTEISGLDWSQDDKSIFYIMMNESSNFEIRQINLANSEERIIHSTAHVIRNLSVNNQIVFEKREINYRFIEIDLNDTIPDKFSFVDLNEGKYWYPTYANLDDQIAYISTQSGHPELWILDPNQEKGRQLTTFNGSHIGRPKWSPNDGQIVFPATRNGNTDIYIYNLQSYETIPLLTTSFKESAPEWSTNGDSLYFSADYNQASQIWSMPAIKGSKPIFFQDLSCDFFIKKGNNIYYSQLTENSIRKLNSLTSKDEVVAEDIRKKDTRSWSIVGNNLYYIKLNPGYNRTLIKKDLVSGLESNITSDEEYINYTMQGMSTYQPGFTISNDEKKIMGITYAGKNPEIMIIKN